jgi:hypothetical protein
MFFAFYTSVAVNFTFIKTWDRFYAETACYTDGHTLQPSIFPHSAAQPLWRRNASAQLATNTTQSKPDSPFGFRASKLCTVSKGNIQSKIPRRTSSGEFTAGNVCPRLLTARCVQFHGLLPVFTSMSSMTTPLLMLISWMGLTATR